MPDDPLLFLLAIVTGVLAAARLTRLIVHDTFPPVVWLRGKYIAHTDDAWGVLMECHWCAGPYATALVLGTAFLPDDLNHLNAWWIIWGWAAASYLASIVVEWDSHE